MRQFLVMFFKFLIFNLFFLLLQIIYWVGFFIWKQCLSNIQKEKLNKLQFSCIAFYENDTKREFFWFFVFLMFAFLFFFFIHRFLIRFPFLVFFTLLLYLFLYVGGGIVATYILWYANKHSDTFSLQEKPFLLKFLDIYDYFFASFYGKVNLSLYVILYWYLDRIHTPLSWFLKTKLTSERFFFYSIFSICFAFFLLCIIPSFISEGLDADFYFAFSFFYVFHAFKDNNLAKFPNIHVCVIKNKPVFQTIIQNLKSSFILFLFFLFIEIYLTKKKPYGFFKIYFKTYF